MVELLPHDIVWLRLDEPVEYWVLSTSAGLKFIRDEDGRSILHQAWSSNLGNLEWRPVPLEDA